MIPIPFQKDVTLRPHPLDDGTTPERRPHPLDDGTTPERSLLKGDIISWFDRLTMT